MAETVFNIAKQRIMRGLTDLDGGDLRAVVITGNKTGVNNPDLADLSAIDALNTGATNFGTERVVLGTLSVSVDNTNDRAVATAATITLAANAETALGLLIYDNASGGTDAARFPILFTDTGFGTGVDLTSGGATVSLPNGYLRGT